MLPFLLLLLLLLLLVVFVASPGCRKGCQGEEKDDGA